MVETLTSALEKKREASVKAKLAIKGHAVRLLAEGGYLVTWNGYCRTCPDLDDLERFARQVGAA